MARLTRGQQLALWFAAAILGLALANLLDADLLGSIGLVAGVGILIGVAVGAWIARHPG
jgi:hypothetical protein